MSKHPQCCEWDQKQMAVGYWTSKQDRNVRLNYYVRALPTSRQMELYKVYDPMEWTGQLGHLHLEYPIHREASFVQHFLPLAVDIGWGEKENILKINVSAKQKIYQENSPQLAQTLGIVDGCSKCWSIPKERSPLSLIVAVHRIRQHIKWSNRHGVKNSIQ